MAYRMRKPYRSNILFVQGMKAGVVCHRGGHDTLRHKAERMASGQEGFSAGERHQGVYLSLS